MWGSDKSFPNFQKIIFIASCLFLLAINYQKKIDKYTERIKDKRQEIKEIEEQLKKEKKSREDYMKKMKELKTSLRVINKNLLNTIEKIRATKRVITEKKKRIEFIEMEMKISESMISYSRATILDEMNIFYRKYCSIPLMFKSHMEREILKRLILNNLEDLSFRLRKKKKLNLDKEIEESLYGKAIAIKKELDKRKKVLRRDLRKVKKNFKKVLEIKKKTERKILQLEKAKKQLTELITKLLKEKKKLIALARREMYKLNIRDLPWPVKGEVTLKFGKSLHPKLDTYIISNGIKIRTPPRMDVRAIESGKVLFADEFENYGKTIIINHKKFITVYAHLGELLAKKDVIVSTSTVIAKTTDSSDSFLYFELRTLDNRPVDPLLFLKQD